MSKILRCASCGHTSSFHEKYFGMCYESTCGCVKFTERQEHLMRFALGDVVALRSGGPAAVITSRALKRCYAGTAREYTLRWVTVAGVGNTWTVPEHDLTLLVLLVPDAGSKPAQAPPHDWHFELGAEVASAAAPARSLGIVTDQILIEGAPGLWQAYYKTDREMFDRREHLFVEPSLVALATS